MNLSSYDLNKINSYKIDVAKYHQMDGSFIYAMTCTRPDLSIFRPFAMNCLCKFLFKISAAQCGHYFIIFQKIQKNLLPYSFIKLVEFCKFIDISLKKWNQLHNILPLTLLKSFLISKICERGTNIEKLEETYFLFRGKKMAKLFL